MTPYPMVPSIISTDPAMHTTTYPRLLTKFISCGIMPVAILALKVEVMSLEFTSSNLRVSPARPL